MAWDEIDVGGPDAQDEYDAYLSPLMHLLHEGGGARGVEAHLTEVVDNHIGPQPDPGRERAFSEALARWWAAGSAE